MNDDDAVALVPSLKGIISPGWWSREFLPQLVFETDVKRLQLGEVALKAAIDWYRANGQPTIELVKARRCIELRIGELLGQVSFGQRTDLEPSLASEGLERMDRHRFRKMSERKAYVLSILEDATDPEEISRAKILKLLDADSLQKMREAKIVRPFPAGKFPIIYADPPWSYSNSGFNQSAASQYPTMTIEEICALPASDLRADWSVLFLWATAPLLTDAIRVMHAWGFSYKTCMVWIKDRAPGMGWWIKTRHELLLIGTHGDPPPPTEKPDSVIECDVTTHSAKPASVYQSIESAFPKVPKIELFSRNKIDGWSAWGNEPDEL